jgi:hypothetical protein
MHERMVERAQQWALRLWHNYVGCEHLLLVLADDGALARYGVTTADVERELRAQIAGWVSEADALRAVGLDPAGVKASVRRSFGADVRIQGIDRSPLFALTPRAQAVLGAAATDADVLPAMIREDTNLGVVILERLGVPLDDLADFGGAH